MKILIVNDDGIMAKGIMKLAEYAKPFGDVWVVAPAHQCSAMSHRITVGRPLTVKKVGQDVFPIEGIMGAYSVDGTPADCVKVGVDFVVPGGPDVVFSGINHGYNAGIDTIYSGTVGAAMDALVFGIPAIAFSTTGKSDYKVMDEYFAPVTEELLHKPIREGHIWNVNFPTCAPEEIKGVLHDRKAAKVEYYLDHYEKIETEEKDTFMLLPHDKKEHSAEEGTDIAALLDKYISISSLGNGVL